ncbi:sensor histidine kinase [Allorhizocola rhizosphaerae]|uniref:sensor histidine kinase n=1 Tax=Allorhizocola rhizosphaerae TaxID=1872709 RepID=UPI000E3B5A56|nr:sensor histidine kinase [Allorhizocola rhizosphaerae]
MSVAAMAGRALEWVRQLLRPSAPLPPLSRRGAIFDAFLPLGLYLLAIQAGGDDAEPRTRMPRPEFDPPGPPMIREPFPVIEDEQTGWPLVMLIAVLPLLFRRRWPLAVLWIVVLTAPLIVDFEAALRLSFYACVIAGYTAAVYSPYRLPALASLPLAAFVYAEIREPAVPTVPDGAVPFLILIPILVVAEGLRRWKGRADGLEREQAEAVRRAAEQERARIARELHDVVTHNVSVMVIQAGAARKVMDADPGQAREALLAVEAGGRAAMTELRHVMGLLTMDGSDPEGLAPQPGLDRLEALVQRVRDTGMPVELTVAGQPRPLLPGVELTAYRVVQEALTNTVKHAAGASASVLIEYGDDRLRVEATDTGGGPAVSAASGNGNGRGLLGLRERLAVYGGTLHAGPRLTGGYRVAAMIPLEAS